MKIKVLKFIMIIIIIIINGILSTTCADNELILTSITVITLPNKTTYAIGEEFNPEGMVVIAEYSDGSVEPIAGYSTSGLDASTTGNKIITIIYKGKSTFFMVTVYKTLESIEVTTLPTRLVYAIGDDFNPAGMIVTANYDDGSQCQIAGYIVNDFKSDTVGIKSIIISFEGKCTIPFAVIIQQPGIFSITFAQIADAAPQIEGPIIYLLEREGKQSTAVVSVQNPEQYDLASIKWYINNNETICNSVTLDLNSNDYNRVGEYFIMVEVKKDGIPYNKTVTFTVVP